MVTGSPDFGRLRKALMLEGEPDRVPLVENGIDGEIKEKFLGRPIRSIADEVEFWATAGYDFVSIAPGFRRALWRGFEVTAELAAKKESLTTAISAEYGLGGEVRERAWASEGRGLIATRADFDAFPWPEPEELIPYEQFAETEKHLPKGMGIIAYQGYIYTPVWWLMGFEGFTNALADDPDLVARLFAKIGELQMRVFEKVIEIPSVSAVWHPDDIAYTEGLIVSPKLLRQHVFPWYRQMGEICRARGLPYIMHTDGDVSEVMDDIVGCHFNALHPFEPKAMDIVAAKRKYGDRLCVMGNIDLGYTLTLGTPEEVDAEVKERIRVLAPGGGYCVSSSNSVPEYVPFANYMAMREATLKYGRYPIQV